MSSQESGKTPTIPTSLRLTPNELAEFRKLAESQHRSVSGELRHMIAQRLAAQTGQAAA